MRVGMSGPVRVRMCVLVAAVIVGVSVAVVVLVSLVEMLFGNSFVIFICTHNYPPFSVCCAGDTGLFFCRPVRQNLKNDTFIVVEHIVFLKPLQPHIGDKKGVSFFVSKKNKNRLFKTSFQPFRPLTEI
jgi:hypothetical protein